MALAAAAAAGQSKRGIRSVDFSNFSYRAGGTDVVLRDGRQQEGHRGEGGWNSYRLAEVKYIDFNGDGTEEAFVVLSFETSGTLANAHDYYVFAYRDGQPRVVFHEWREKPLGARARGRSIEIVAPFWESGGSCCPEGIETSIYSWRRARFALTIRKRGYINKKDWWLDYAAPRTALHGMRK